MVDRVGIRNSEWGSAPGRRMEGARFGWSVAVAALAAAALAFLLMPLMGMNLHVETAFAAQGDNLAVGCAEAGVAPMASASFKVSTTKLTLTPKVKKTKNGYKCTPVTKTVTVTVPNTSYFPVECTTSDSSVAVGEWAKSNTNTKIKLYVTGVGIGKATLSISNAKTKKVRKITVTVGGKKASIFASNAYKVRLASKKAIANGQAGSLTRSKTLLVTAPYGASVTATSSDSRVATAKWGKWSGNTVKLKITAYRAGNTTVTLSNTKTKKTRAIAVTVKGATNETSLIASS